MDLPRCIQIPYPPSSVVLAFGSKLCEAAGGNELEDLR
jgi:hypothetical protein